MLSADKSLKKINLGFPQEQNSICFHVRSNGISEGCIDFIQILGKTTTGQIHQRCWSTQAQDCEHQSCTWKALWLQGPESSELQPCRDETQKSLGQSMSTEFCHTEKCQHRALALTAGLQNSKHMSVSLLPSLLCKDDKRQVLPLGTRVKEMLSRRWTNSSGNAKPASWEVRHWYTHLFSWGLEGLKEWRKIGENKSSGQRISH